MDAVRDAELAAMVREVRLGVIRLARRMRAQKQEHGVTPLELSVLSRLYGHQVMTPKALADAEHVTPQTLTRVFAALEDKGLVIRRGNPEDGRQSLLEITPAGVRVLGEDSARREQWLAAAMTSALTPAEQQIVRIAAGLMERLADEPGI
ncbi:MarR family transcriptional regulator [Rugosimonospora acidiphila]|uniref:MarR family transcriptional regulator n=1 Tax=Rugosimonospora acidiphila TaxID=556531 RepID=A0ABP9RVM4_9ACTN